MPSVEIEYDELPCPNPLLLGPCHVFRAGKNRAGYGCVWRNGKMLRVHRYVWEQTHGPIPPGMEIDHQCRVRACCNVDHLRVVTGMVNRTENVEGVAWQIHRAKTHCPAGHPYAIKDKGGGRRCRECKNEANRRYRRKNRKSSSQP